MLPGGRRCLHSASTAAQACFHHAAGAADTETLGLMDHVLLSSWYSECLRVQDGQHKAARQRRGRQDQVQVGGWLLLYAFQQPLL